MVGHSNWTVKPLNPSLFHYFLCLQICSYVGYQLLFDHVAEATKNAVLSMLETLPLTVKFAVKIPAFILQDWITWKWTIWGAIQNPANHRIPKKSCCCLQRYMPVVLLAMEWFLIRMQETGFGSKALILSPECLGSCGLTKHIISLCQVIRVCLSRNTLTKTFLTRKTEG